MSGTGFKGALFPQPIQLTKPPPPGEGPKAVPVNINWQNVFDSTGGFIQQINLLSQYQSGQFSTVQSLYVDNQTCPEMITIVAADTGQQIRVPPFTKGVYPLFSSQSPEFSVTLNLSFDPVTGNAFSACSTRLFFLNIQQPYFEAAPSNFGQNFNKYTGLLQFGNGITNAALTQGANSGSGMIAIGGNQHYALTSMDLSVNIVSPYAAAFQTPLLALQEIGAKAVNLWTGVFYATNTTVGTVVSRNIIFSTPIIQFQDQSFLNFVVFPSPTPANGVSVAIDLTYSIVTIV